MEAVFENKSVAFGAVGFQNGANDSDEQKKAIKSKFKADLKSAISSEPGIKVFVFLTNLHFTMGEQNEMKKYAKKCGIEYCDIIDRERLRIELDSPSGFFIRFQHLGIPLSEAEQTSFLARYGDRIQEVVSTGFLRMERTLNRILFLQEASNVLSGIYVSFRLKEDYPASDIGHFRAFVSIFLRAVKYDIWEIFFGCSDKSTRFRVDVPEEWNNEAPGIANGVAHGQWERHLKLDQANGKDDQVTDEEKSRDGEDYVLVGSGSAIGIDPVPAIFIRYYHDDELIRFRPRLKLRDLDDCSFIPILNQSLADKLHSIEVYANGYKLAHIGPNEFSIDCSPFEANLDAFTPKELTDRWVRIRPSDFASSFDLRFTSTTPRRMFEYEEPRDSKLPNSE